MFQYRAEQGADARRSCSDNQHGVIRRDFADACCPKASSKNVTDKQCLFIGHAIGDVVKPLLCQGYSHVFRLSTVDAAAKCPTSMWGGAVVHIAMFAVEAFSAESLHVYGHTVAFAESLDFTAQFFHNANHLMTDSYPWHSSRYATMLDVQVARTDAAYGHTNDGIRGLLYRRFGLIN